MKLFATIFCLLLLFCTTVLADLGPKPTITINFLSQNEFIPDGIKLDAFLLQCETADCQNAKRLEPIGPQHFSCLWDCDKKIVSCGGMAYGFSKFLQLDLVIKGKLIRSNIFLYSPKKVIAALKTGKLTVNVQ